MTTHLIEHGLVELALARADTSSFEKFAQAFSNAAEEYVVVPLGGMHDGGADGFVEQVLEDGARRNHYFQASKEASVGRKVRKTVRRLREFGREVQSLLFYTSRQVPLLDQVEEALEAELGIRVKIRDAAFIAARINSSPASVQAFNTYLRPSLSFLQGMGTSSIINETANLPVRDLCVFLSQEVSRRRNQSSLLESVTDSLILWALEGTDPDEGRFLSREEVGAKIEQALPAAKQFIRSVLDSRLARLSAKGGAGGREIRWHPKVKGYCLPYETRRLVAEENVEDELLKLAVSEEFRLQALEVMGDDADAAIADEVIDCCHGTLERLFERQGMEIAKFVEGAELVSGFGGTVADALKEVLASRRDASNSREIVYESAMELLRRVFYDSSRSQREYLDRLSRTYILLFLLKNEPKIVEYFSSMSGKLMLYVGADILIRALSEHYLRDADKTTFNMLKIIRASGSKLILTQKTLDEVWTHLRATTLEFTEEYKSIEHHVTLELARNFSKILIRAYFYARLDPDKPSAERPTSFSSYMSQFVDFRDLIENSSQDSLQAYLTIKFGLSFEALQVTKRGIDEEKVVALRDKLLASKRRPGRPEVRESMLAYNDALQVYRIYQRRVNEGDTNPANQFGFSTWWLTQETAIRRATKEVVKEHGGRLYMMRPEFLLNFISFSPKLAAVRESYKSIFPSLLGVKLSNRLKPDVFRRVVREAKEMVGIDDARAASMLANLANELKSDFGKEYEHYLIQKQPVEA